MEDNVYTGVVQEGLNHLTQAVCTWKLNPGRATSLTQSVCEVGCAAESNITGQMIRG